jgi:hypothetical protein
MRSERSRRGFAAVFECGGSGRTGAAEGSDGLLRVLRDEVCVESNDGSGPFAGGGDDLCPRVRGVPGNPYPRHAGTTGAVGYGTCLAIAIAASRSSASIR